MKIAICWSHSRALDYIIVIITMEDDIMLDSGCHNAML